MATKAGVWIDHRRAIVVLVTDTGKTIKKIASGIQSPVHSRSQHEYTKNDFFADDRRQNKAMTHLTTFYKEVIDCVRGAEAILVIGPGEAKELRSNASRTRNSVAGLLNLKRLIK